MRVAIDEGDGSPVVLLHGQPGSAALWLPALPALLDTGARIIAVDRPGYDGRPERARGFAGNSTRLVALLDELGLEQAVLVGHSWGGGVALQVALDAPQRVRGLLLLASVGAPRSVVWSDRVLAHPRVGRLAAAVALAGIPGTPALLAWSAGGPTDRTTREALHEVLAHWRSLRAAVAFAVEQRALVAELPAITARLAEIRAPSIVLHGSSDRMVSPAAGRELAALLPTSRLVSIRAGHGLAAEAPELVAALLSELIGRPPDQPAT